MSVAPPVDVSLVFSPLSPNAVAPQRLRPLDRMRIVLETSRTGSR